MTENIYAKYMPNEDDAGDNIYAKYLPEKKPHPSLIGDIAKSAGAGLVKGALGIPGAIGDVRALVNLGLDKLIGAPPRVERSALGIDLSPPTTAALQRGVEAVTGPFYEPQTTAGKFAGTAAEFVPGAALLPGAAAARAINALRFGVIPGVASEAAGQVTEGTAAEPWARAGAGILGGIAGGVRRAKPQVPPPSAEEIKEASRAEYAKAFETPVNVKRGGVRKLAADVKGALTEFGYHPRLQSSIVPVLGELKNLSRRRGGSTLKQLDTVRRIAGQAARHIDPSTRAAAGIVKGKIDDFLGKLGEGDIAGDVAKATEAAGALKQAQTGWRTARKTEIIEDLIEKATETAASSGSGGNINNALRTQFKNLLTNPKRARDFNTVELAAMRDVVKGSTFDNIARLAGKLGPSGNGLMLAINLGHAAFSPITGIPGAIVGAAAKRYSDTKTRDRAARALGAVAGGGKSSPPLVTKFGTFPRSESGLRALAAALAGHSALADQIPQPLE